jgi:hypothetical protein
MYTRAFFIVTLAIVQSCGDLAPMPRITFEQARKAALAQAPGHVKREELTHENGRWIYSFLIDPGDVEAAQESHINRRALLHIVVDAGADG